MQNFSNLVQVEQFLKFWIELKKTEKCAFLTGKMAISRER